MPHNTLRLQGGVVVNETPVLNQAGIAVSNRIRFRPDQQGLTLPEKLGGWAKFYASTITAGIVRVLWGWQDTNNNQWIAYAADSSTATQLGAIQCTVNGGTGLTSATGTLQNITPDTFSSQSIVHFETSAGSNLINYVDSSTNLPIPSTPGAVSVYITTPVAVGGIVLNGQYQQSDPLGSGTAAGNGQIISTDVLGNPLPAVYTTVAPGSITITGVTFTAGSPNTLTIAYSGTYTFPPNDNINVRTADNIITGSYIVLSSTSSTVTVATQLLAYTFSTTGTIDNFGVVPIYSVPASSSFVVTVTFPNHGQSVGSDWVIINPTTLGGITLYGQYTVQSVINSYSFTIFASTKSTAGQFEYQYQNAIPVTGGTQSVSATTLDFSITPYNFYLGNLAVGSLAGIHIIVRDVVFSGGGGDGQFTVTTNNAGTVTYSSSFPAGTWVRNGTWSPVGGVVGYVYNIAENLPPPNSNNFGASFWTLDSWGNDLIAVPGNEIAIKYPTNPLHYQPIYYWDPTAASGNIQAQAIPTGPVVSNGAFVAMPQRQIFAWGSSFSGIIDPLLIRWSDVNNFNTWVAQVTNQAGSFRLPSGAAIIGARQVNQQALFWTDIELWVAQYINQPLVWGFNKVGIGCGLIGKYAHGVLGGITYWMSKTQFWMLSGDGAVAIPCPIWDVVFQDLDLVNADKITCATNAMFQEITWYFPVKSGTGENSQYIKLNISQLVAGGPPLWDYGTLDRSAWVDVSVLQQPIGFSPVNQLIYQHEISPDADGVAMGESFTTGWFSIAEGDQMPFVDQVWPDFKWGYFAQAQSANINLTISGTDYPGLAVQTVGPYTVTQSTTWISPRMRHRLLSFTVAGTGTGTWWRLGGVRYRFQPDGKF